MWAFSAIYQSLIFYYFVTTSTFTGQNSSGKMFGLWDVSTVAFTCVVVTVNLRLLMMCNSITRWHYISVGGSILAWFLFVFVYSLIRVSPSPSITLLVLNLEIVPGPFHEILCHQERGRKEIPSYIYPSQYS